MKKGICFLFLLLVACVPVTSFPIATPALGLTSTPIFKNTPTAIPTVTLEPSPTPEIFRLGANRNVQIYEGGKYVDLQAPEGIWGPVDGTKVVLVVNEEGGKDAYTQMELNDFQTPDGVHIVNVAKYNEKTKSWELLPFSFTRSGPEKINFNPLNSYLRKTDIGILDLYSTFVNILGLRSDGASMEIMVLYKGEVRVLGLDQINIYKPLFSPTDPTIGYARMEIIAPEGMAVSDVVETVDGLNRSLLGSKPFVIPVLHFFVVSAGATEKDCDEISNYYYDIPKLEKWCKDQAAMGTDRKIPSRSEVEWALVNKSQITIDENSEFPDLNSLWTGATVLEIEGTLVELYLEKSWRP